MHWHDFRKEGFLEDYPKDVMCEGSEAFDHVTKDPAAADSDSDSACVSDCAEACLDDEEEPLGSLDSMEKYLAAGEHSACVASDVTPISAASASSTDVTPIPAAASASESPEGSSGKSAKEVLLDEAIEKALAAARAGLAAVRSSGGDTVAEELLLDRIEQLEKRQASSRNPVALHLKEKQQQRWDQIAQEKKEREQRSHEIALGKLEIKKQAEQNLQLKLAGSLDKAKAKEAELELKKQKDALKEKAKQEVLLNKELQVKLAAHTCRQLKRRWQDHDGAWESVGEHAIHLADKGTKLKAIGIRGAPIVCQMHRLCLPKR